MSAPRVLVSTFGSAGDLFPLIPVIHGLAAAGCEVRVASGRGVGLYLRSLGIPTVGLGDGTELRVVNDPEVFSTRFDGWHSWRRTVTHYVAPTLGRDVAALSAVVAHWAPDVMVTSGFGAAARIVAHRQSVPRVELSIYPQHARLATQGHGWARSYVRLVAELANQSIDDKIAVAELAWGAPADVVLHDRALLGSVESGLEPVGFPYWDAVTGRPDDEARAAEWLATEQSTVLVTLGSFIGVAQQDAWRAAADALARLGRRGLFVGARGHWADEQFAGRPDLCCVGFVPLTHLIKKVDAVVHHGGIGTTFATLHGRRASVVLPQAFDQSFNARLVERAGAGLDGSGRDLYEALRQVLRPEARAGAEAVANRLVAPDVAAQSATSAVLQAGAIPEAKIDGS